AEDSELTFVDASASDDLGEWDRTALVVQRRHSSSVSLTSLVSVVHDSCTMSPAIQEIRRAQGQATRDRILESTATLLHDSSPATLTMPAVAEAAGVSVRTLYVHFPNKRVLYDALHDW